MSVYLSQRSESKAEFIRVSQDLAVYTLEQVKKFPKSYRFCLTNDLTKLALEIHENVCRANSIYIHKNMSEMEFNMREKYFVQAKSAIYVMSSLLTVTYALIIKGNNFLGDKKHTSHIFKEWARLLNYETSLVKGVVESDKKRYKRYQKSGKTSDKKKNENETEPQDENEIVLPEETFDIEDTEN